MTNKVMGRPANQPCGVKINKKIGQKINLPMIHALLVYAVPNLFTSLKKRLITFCMIILAASASAVFMIGYVFFTDFNFHSAFVTCNNLVLGNYFEIFCFTWRFVMGRIKIVAG